MNMVLITSGEFEGRAAYVLSFNDTESVIKLFDTDEEFTINNDLIKRKKQCSCSKSKKYPLCDGSHSGS